MSRIDILWHMKLLVPESTGTVVNIELEPFARKDILSVKDRGTRRKLRKLNRLLGFKIW